MPKLPVAADLAHLYPSVLLEFPDDLPHLLRANLLSGCVNRLQPDLRLLPATLLSVVKPFCVTADRTVMSHSYEDMLLSGHAFTER